MKASNRFPWHGTSRHYDSPCKRRNPVRWLTVSPSACRHSTTALFFCPFLTSRQCTNLVLSACHTRHVSPVSVHSHVEHLGGSTFPLLEAVVCCWSVSSPVRRRGWRRGWARTAHSAAGSVPRPDRSEARGPPPRAARAPEEGTQTQEGGKAESEHRLFLS